MMSRPYRIDFRVCLAFSLFLWPCRSFRPASKFVNSPPRLITKEQPSTFASPLYAKGKKNMSSSEQEKRDEERRRNTRKEDVVIGKTSAKQGETDYVLDPKGTEEEYLRQLSNQEKDIYHLTNQGMQSLNSLKLEEANRSFDKVFELRPNAYVWQAGIVKFYLGEIEAAADIFARSARTYESKFGSQASEERIWRDACELKFLNSMSLSKRKEVKDDVSTIIKTIPPFKSDDIFSKETRKIILLAGDMFGASVDSNPTKEILARAKLRSYCGAKEKYPTPDRKMWKLNAWFYQGLHLDTLGDFDESKKCMKMALKLCPSSGKSDDIVHTLPLLHMSVRNWFDDDEFDDDPFDKESKNEEDLDFDPPKSKFKENSYAYADPFIEESIRKGVEKMRGKELKEALRMRGLNIIGSKHALQERLFYSLMDDSGFQSGFAP